MWLETKLAPTGDVAWVGDPDCLFDSWEEFRGWIELEYGILRIDHWRDDKARCWETDSGVLLADVVEYVELDRTEDLAHATRMVRGLVSPLAPEQYRSVPVYVGGEEIGRVEL